MKLWFNAKKTAAKSLMAVICVMSLVVTGITGCGTSQPDDANTVSNATGGDEGRQENVTQQAQTNVQEEEGYKLPDFDVEEEKPVVVDLDEDWPVEYLLASTGDGSGFSGDSSYPRRDGFEVYAFTPENVRCSYDNTNGFGIKISDTGSEDWHIQLKKNGITVENGKWYQVTFDAKSSIERSIIFSMQRDGSADEDWRSYSGNKIVQLGNDWKPYTIIFRMTDDTDNKAIYNFSLGTVGGDRIRQQHTVNIKNMQLEELEDTWLDRVSQEGNLLKNPNFKYDDIAWEASVVEPGAAKVKFENGKAIFDISNVGTTDWHIQLKQDSITMEHGYNYRLTFKASSTASRSINIGFMDKDFVNWYGGSLEALNAGAERTVAVEFYMDKATDKDVCIFISMGKIENMNTPASVITLSDFRLEKLPGRPSSSGSWSGGGGWTAPIVNFGDGWEVSYWFGRVGKCSKTSDTYHIEILDTGSLDWHVQMQKKGIELEKGKKYRMSFEAMSSIGRTISCALQKDGTNDEVWTSYSGGSGLYQLNGDWQTFTHEFTMSSETDRNVIYNISLGAVNGRITNAHDVYFRNIKIEEIADEPIVPVPVGKEMLTGEWELVGGTRADKTEADGIVTVEIFDVGTEDHHVQIKKSGLTLEEGCIYKFECDASFANGERVIKVGLMQDGTYAWYDGTEFTINGTENKCEFTFTVKKPTIKDAMLAISLGKIEDKETPTGTVTLSNISLVKTAEKPDKPDDPDDTGLTLIADVKGNLLKGKIFDIDETAGAVISVSPDKTKINITDVGTEDYSVKLHLADSSKLALKAGCTYEFTADVKFEAAEGEVKQTRTIKVGFMDQGYNNWYGGTDDEIKNESNKIKADIALDADDNNVNLFISMGKIANEETPKGTITISNLSLVKTSGGEEPEIPEAPANLLAKMDGNILTYPIKADNMNGATPNNELTQFVISELGSENWSNSIEKEIQLVNGHKYKFSGKVYSSTGRKIDVCIQSMIGAWDVYVGGTQNFTANEMKEIDEEFIYNGPANDKVRFFVGMGKVGDDDVPGIIQLSDFSLIDLDAAETPIEGNILPELADDNGWYFGNGGNKVTFNYEGGTAIIDINDLGVAAHEVQFSHALNLKKGAEYAVSCDVVSNVDRPITVCVQQNEAPWGSYKTDTKTLEANKKQTFAFNFTKDDEISAAFAVNMGKFDDSTPTGTITLSNISVVKIADAPEQDDSGQLIADGENNILKDRPKWIGGEKADNNATLSGTKIEISALNEGTLWDILFGINEFTLVDNEVYIVTCRIKSSVERNVDVRVEGAGYDYCSGVGTNTQLPANVWVPITMKVVGKDGVYTNPEFHVYVGRCVEGELGQHTITICDISLVEESKYAESTNEGISTLSSDTEIEASLFIDDADEEETDEDVADEETEDDEEIQENIDENLKTDEITPEDTPNDYVTPETADTSPNEDGNDSDDSN